jgi:hypothetical protein
MPEPTTPPTLEKRGPGDQVPSIGTCNINPATVVSFVGQSTFSFCENYIESMLIVGRQVTTPLWTVGLPWLNAERAGGLAGTQTDMSRWYATTVEAPCNAKMTVLPEASLPGTFHPKIDHACKNVPIRPPFYTIGFLTLL